MRHHLSVGLALLQASSIAAEYVWPNKYDELEDVMMLLSGYIRKGFADAVSPCSFGTNVEGIQNAAEWIRTAYHDMATHDAAAGTGGLDASIMFELDRAENIGTAFNTTLGFMSNYYTVRTSASDLLALAVVTATSMCDGPRIPYRAGRIDATEAGPLGVPKPEEDIKTHTSRFATAGFNTTDMITMVACGHTLGGVHGVNFPEITGNSSAGQVSRFEGNNGTAFSKFDNVVVSQYLDNEPGNLLVHGSNETMNSDKRVFEADGNETMNALADAAVFQSKCADVMERMINAVPSTVTLTDEIQPAEIKPYITTLGLNSNGTIDFKGRIRVRVTAGIGRNISDLDVHLTYADHNGANASSPITTTKATTQGGTSSGLFREYFLWFEFATVIDPSTGISKFNVHVTTPSTGVVELFDNAGQGFPLEDSILYQQLQSCYSYTGENLTIAVAVKKERAEETLTLNLVHKVPRQGVIVPALEVRPVTFAKTDVEKGDYVLFQAQSPLASKSQSTTFDVILGEGDAQSTIEFQRTNVLTDVCKSL